ncbi:MAG: hypothetical protein HKO64_07780 [Xanthomonadales bacterium]|nr:hypothetical protein [Xanthomonadales bacterium]
MISGDHKQIASELVVDGSVEFSHGDVEQIEAIAERLPYQMPVMVPCLPRRPLESMLPALQAIQEASLEPVPHIPARHVESTRALAKFLQQAGVRKAVVIGGDRSSAKGPFADATALLSSGCLAENGIREVGFAAYPEGHPTIPAEALFNSLSKNIDLASGQGQGSFIITQFTLSPQRIPDLCSRLASAAPDTPVYAGIPGPATHEQVVHFARYCGVSTSLTAVSGVGVKLAQVVDHERPGQQLGLLASYCAAHPGSNLVGVHIYGFGGMGETAKWIRRHINP